MITKHLTDAILDQGIRNVNYFNGRLLSAEDLKAEQEANRRQHWQLGRAIGHGIVRGLEVTASSNTTPTVRVALGLALNRKGQALLLPTDIEVPLVAEEQTAAEDAGIFSECEPSEATTVLTGTGIFLLVLCPASGFAERAPMSGLTTEVTANRGCGSRFAVEGVRLRRIPFDLHHLPDIDPSLRTELLQLMASTGASAHSKLRNLLAHLFFGSGHRQQFIADPFPRKADPDAFSAYGPLDSLRATGILSDCDVPLAVVYVTSAGLRFVDNWSVRRRVISVAVDGSFEAWVRDRRLAESEARLFQFQDQLEEIRLGETNPKSVVALDRLAFLPSAGLLPLAGPVHPRGFDYAKFFEGQRYPDPPALLNGAQVEVLLDDARSYPPIGLRSGELIWLYRIRENVQANNKDAKNPPQQYLLFASGHMTYRANPLFDLARWNFSSFA